MNPTAPPFSPLDAGGLVNTLAALLGGAIGCNITLDGMVVAGLECRGNVELNGTELPCCTEKAGSWTCDEACRRRSRTAGGSRTRAHGRADGRGLHPVSARAGCFATRLVSVRCILAGLEVRER